MKTEICAKRQRYLYNLFLKSVPSFLVFFVLISTTLDSAKAYSPQANQCSSIYSTANFEINSPQSEKSKSKNNFANGDHRDEIKIILDQYSFPEKFNVDKSDKILREAMFRAFKQKCLYTCLQINRSQISVDHILPESQGGPNNIYNFVLAEKNINSDKSDKFDNISAIGLLSIVRLHFAPLMIHEYQKIMIDLFNLNSTKNAMSDGEFKNSEQNETQDQNPKQMGTLNQPVDNQAHLSITNFKTKKLLYAYMVFAKSKSQRITLTDLNDGHLQIRMAFFNPTVQEISKLQNFIDEAHDMKIVITENNISHNMDVIQSAELIRGQDDNLFFQFNIPIKLLTWFSKMTTEEALTLLEKSSIPVQSNLKK
jgi:hypothetical protein